MQPLEPWSMEFLGRRGNHGLKRSDAMSSFPSQQSGVAIIVDLLTRAGASPDLIANTIKPILRAKELRRMARQTEDVYESLSLRHPIDEGDHHLN